MRRGELYRVHRASLKDPRRHRVFAVVSRQALLDSRFSAAICAPVYTRYDGLTTQVPVGVEEGVKQESSLHCDELVSIPKTALTHYLGALSSDKLRDLNRALAIALSLDRP